MRNRRRRRRIREEGKNVERRERKEMEGGWEVKDERDGERGKRGERRRRMMEASSVHATAVSSRQKAVCIIMGCHLISSEEGSGGGDGVRLRGDKSGRL